MGVLYSAYSVSFNECVRLERSLPAGDQRVALPSRCDVPLHLQDENWMYTNVNGREPFMTVHAWRLRDKKERSPSSFLSGWNEWWIIYSWQRFRLLSRRLVFARCSFTEKLAKISHSRWNHLTVITVISCFWLKLSTPPCWLIFFRLCVELLFSSPLVRCSSAALFCPLIFTLVHSGSAPFRSSGRDFLPADRTGVLA